MLLQFRVFYVVNVYTSYPFISFCILVLIKFGGSEDPTQANISAVNACTV